MEILLTLNLDSIFDETLLFLGNYGFVLVIIFGISHPLIENPLSLFNLALAITLLGIPFGYTVVFLANIIGILLLYYLAKKFNKKTNDVLLKKKVSEKALNWIENTPTWKHIIVIGVPFIPTYPIKIGVPFSNIGFKKYMITLIGAYVFLIFGNTLIYFGIAGFITKNIPNYISFVLLALFVIYIYFGHKVFKKNRINELLD